MAKVTFEIGKSLIDKTRENSNWFEKVMKRYSRKTFKYLMEIPIEVVYSYGEVERIFNDYTIKYLDLDLHAYDEFIPIADDNGITMDLTDIEEDYPSEYDLIVNSLVGHYGKSIFTDDGSCEDRVLNAELIMRKTFPKASVSVVEGGISVVGDMTELKFS